MSSLLDKIFSRAESQDGSERDLKTNKTMRKLGHLKVGDEVVITQRVKITDLRDALDRRIGTIGGKRTIYMEVQGVGGVFNNLKAVASGSEEDKIEVAKGQAQANVIPSIVVVDRDEDEMHGTSLPFDR